MTKTVPRTAFDLFAALLLRMDGAPACARALIAATAYQQGCVASDLPALCADLDRVVQLWSGQKNMHPANQDVPLRKIYKALRLRFHTYGARPPAPDQEHLIQLAPLREVIDAVRAVAEAGVGLDVEVGGDAVVFRAAQPQPKEETP